ncbi:MAG: vWA domain-containing protein [Planctomycetota bacterium]|jgi:hypothetical protein
MSNSKSQTPVVGSVAQRPWQAAALSGAVHLGLLLLFAWLFRLAAPGQTLEEGPRRVALVLTESSDDSERETTYLERPPAPSPADAAAPSQVLPSEPVPLPPAPAKIEPAPLPAPGPATLIASASEMTSGVRGEQPSNELSSATLEAIAAEQRELANRPPPAPLATTSLFGSGPLKGRKFVFVLDRSKSMGTGGLDVLSTAQVELFQALAPLAPENEFQIVAYHQQTVTLKERKLLRASEEHKSEVNEFLQRLVPFGSTDHEAGLYMALDLDPDTIILLTDGDTPELNDGQIQAIARVSKGRAAIHCIQFGLTSNEPPGSFMRKLAAKTGGTYRYVDVNQLRDQKR